LLGKTDGARKQDQQNEFFHVRTLPFFPIDLCCEWPLSHFLAALQKTGAGRSRGFRKKPIGATDKKFDNRNPRFEI